MIIKTQRPLCNYIGLTLKQKWPNWSLFWLTWETAPSWKISFVVQLLSHVRFFVYSWIAALQSSLSFTISLSFAISQSLLKLMSIESMMSSSCLFLCRPLFLLPSIFSSIRVFSNDLALHIRWPKNGSFGFSISPSNEYSGLVSFRFDWFDLLAAQETLKSLLQHHSSKVSILQRSDFFMVPLSHLYMTTRKTIALTIWTFVSKVPVRNDEYTKEIS